MGKGLLILLGTFIVVAILHVVSMKIMKISEAKKSSFRKVFFYIYGVFLVLSGILQCVEKDEIRVVFLIQSLCGLAFVILNFTGKMEQKTSKSYHVLGCVLRCSIRLRYQLLHWLHYLLLWQIGFCIQIRFHKHRHPQ